MRLIQRGRWEIIIWRGSVLLGGAAILNAVAVLLARWAVNAEQLGAHDFGLALALSFVSALGLLASGIAAVVLVALAFIVAFFHRKAALWLGGAAVVCAVPWIVA